MEDGIGAQISDKYKQPTHILVNNMMNTDTPTNSNPTSCIINRTQASPPGAERRSLWLAKTVQYMNCIHIQPEVEKRLLFMQN